MLGDLLLQLVHQFYRLTIFLFICSLFFVLFLLRTYSPLINTVDAHRIEAVIEQDEQEEEEEEEAEIVGTRKKRILAEVTVTGVGDLVMTSEVVKASEVVKMGVDDLVMTNEVVKHRNNLAQDPVYF